MIETIDAAAQDGPASRRSAEPSPDVRADLSRRGFRLGLAMLAVLSVVVSISLSSFLFPRLTGNSDEGAYLAQAEAMAEGQLFSRLPIEGRSAYVPWFASVRDGNVVYKYTPVFSAPLAVSIRWLGSPLPVLAATVAATVVLVGVLARLLGLRRRAALLAGVLFLVAPGVVLQTGAYLPYLFTLGLLLFASCAAIAGRSTGRGLFLVASGLAWGTAFFARPYDAVLFALPLAFLLLRAAPRRPEIVKASMLFAAGALPLLLLFLAYNRAATGSALQLPFSQLEPRDSLGFGKRRVLPQDPLIDYTPARALWSIGVWLGLVANSIAGGLLLFALGVYGVGRNWARRRRGPWPFVPLLLMSWIIGYGFFWGIYAVTKLWTGAVFLGPYYFLPVLAILTISGARELESVAKRSPVFVVAVVVAVLSMAGAVSVLARENLIRTRARVEVAAHVDAALSSSSNRLLLVPPYRGPNLQHPFSWLRNQPDLGGPTRYALTSPPAVFDAIEQSPGRVIYLVSVPSDFADWNGTVDGTTVTEQQVLSGSEVDVDVRVEAGDDVDRIVELGGGRNPCRLRPSSLGLVRLRVWTVDGQLVVTARSGRESCTVDFTADAGHLVISHRLGESHTDLLVPWRLRGSEVIDVLVPGEIRTWSSELAVEVIRR